MGRLSRLLLTASSLASLFAFGTPLPLSAGCTATCTGSAWQKQARLPALGSGAGSGPEVVMVGFGRAQADAPVVCQPSDPNPPLGQADLSWEDFRFYADLPGVGLFKGRLEPSQPSGVHLAALGPGGLYPAQLTNHLFIRLTSLAMPQLQYRTPTALEMSAPSTPAAPPPESVVSQQVHAVDLLQIVNPVPGAPPEVQVTQAVQRFCTGAGIDLTLIAQQQLRRRFRVSNPSGGELAVAYFGHSPEVAPAALDALDGLLTVPANGSAEFELDFTPLPIPAGSTLYVDAIVLHPADPFWCRRWTERLQEPPLIPVASPLGLLVMALALLAVGTWLLRRARP
ncbi:MAG TPA: hypothetical protein PK413_02625 [Thermoanaerobaculia bacterium]|nr:hypothetical protein [Thermoanaerobaculia bacterium]